MLGPFVSYIMVWIRNSLVGKNLYNMWHERPPPLYYVLLWQHFCYYRRRRIVLLFNIFLPFILLIFMSVMIQELSKKSSNTEISEGSFKAMSLLSSDITQFIEETYSCDQQQEDVTQTAPSRYCSRGSVSSGNKFDCTGAATQNCNITISSRCRQLFYGNIDNAHDPTGVLMMGYILYYPKTSVQGRTVMRKVVEKLSAFNLMASRDSTTLDSSSFSKALSNFLKFKDCWINIENRVIGFNTLNELTNFTQTSLSKQFKGWSTDPMPLLWGVVSFETTDDNFKSNQFKYTLLFESGYNTINNKDIWLQDLVEEAAVKTIVGRRNLPVTAQLRNLPTKCWTKPPRMAYQLAESWVAIIITMGFSLMPATFLTLIVEEKMLKLREYLYVMGVNDFTLKLSWIVFFSMFLLPMAVGLSKFISIMPCGVFAGTDASILYVFVILYAVSQLCWTYFLSTLLSKPDNAGFLVAFFNIFLSAISFNLYRFGKGTFSGSFLIIARIMSLHVSFPFTLAMTYVVNWEAMWAGAQWRRAFASPNVGDEYRGFGECLIWMVGDCFLYVLLAWYFQHLFPGEFGVKYPFYFIFQKSFWFPPTVVEDHPGVVVNEDQVGIEQCETTNEVGISLESLTKRYPKDKYGINNLSLTFYKNEVTAFLGENGAGKSTTMNILVGLINSSGGEVWIHGLNLKKQMTEIRKLLAYVPQYDILYPSMTVEEHIQFFGWLRQLSKTEILTTTDRLLKMFDLVHQRKSLTTKLSGGQKRKLSILTAYIGDPKVIILDEPTSAVDPFSRRSIWNIVSQHRIGRTTILSTHFMEEADVLGDRTAIISLGKLQCAGSSLYLKNLYGQGYRLTIVRNPNCSSENLNDFVLAKIPSVKVVQENGNDQTYSVPVEFVQSKNMANFLKDLEDEQEKLGVLSFGVTEPSMEEVFFAAIGGNQKREHHDSAAIPTQGVHVEYGNLKKADRKISLWAQFVALFKKRALLTVRNPSSTILHFSLPLFFLGVLLLINADISVSSVAQTVNIYANYRTNVFFFQDKGGMGNEFLTAASKYGMNPTKLFQSTADQSLTYLDTPKFIYDENCPCTTYCQKGQALNYKSGFLPSGDLIYPLDASVNASAWILLANQSEHWIIGGFEFFQKTLKYYNSVFFLYDNDDVAASGQKNITTIWTVPYMDFAMLNAYNNLLVRMLQPGWSVIYERKTETLLTPSDNRFANIASLVVSILSCIFLIQAFIYATFGMANLVQHEQSKGLKQLQFIAGANPVIYWLSNLIWDCIQFTVVIILMFVLLAAVSNPFHNQNFDCLLLLVLLLIPYVIGSISFTYLLTFIIKTPQMLNKIMTLIGAFALTAAVFLAICCVYHDIDQSFNWVVYVSNTLCLFPYYYIGESIAYIMFSRSFNQQFMLPGTSASVFLDYDKLGRRVVEASISAVVLFLVVIFLENTIYSVSSIRTARVSPSSQETFDIDVLTEKQKISSNATNGHPLIIRHVVKTYPKQLRPAVNGVSFSVPRAQCFGLLGINGAGKTSLFRILTGFSNPSHGSATIEDVNIHTHFQNAAKHFGYCPQENTLFDRLTPEEHLRFMGSLSGISKKVLNEEVKELLGQVGLDGQNKYAYQLSGGNQRKLQFAMALLDYKSVIFLDEPTTGMDPGARRLTWNCITNCISRGCSVVLTSHSMEECEALCHRLVIMVAGNFSCIGSVQYLKNKFGNKYTFKVKLFPPHGEQEVVELKNYFQFYLPGARLVEEHHTLLVFEIAADDLVVSRLFEILCNAKNQYSSLLEDFTTSQISLERVFINMAKRQQLLQASQLVA